MKGIVFDIQNYALHDGPGIRSCVFLKGCPLRCRWCHNPESIRPEPQPAYFSERCEGCGKCVAVCPHGALSLGRLNGDALVVRNPRRCLSCGSCVGACTSGAMEQIGRLMTAEAVVEQVALDRPFFDDSGGGVTLTGGEPTFQKDFLLALLKRFRDAKIHTAVETCGHFPSSLAGPLADAADLVLFDLKHRDPVLHKQGTGADNRLILENFQALTERAAAGRVVARIPVIPGFNADPESMGALAAYLGSIRHAPAVELMPWNGWARTKYERIGRPETFGRRENLKPGLAEQILSLFRGAGIRAAWPG